MANGDIDVDPLLLENEDSSYESSGYDTSTQSLTSSLNEYIHENGRRYHAYFGPDKNLMPTDETEQDRLDLHHEIMSQLLDGKLHKAPLDVPHRILDIGTGTGIWAIDMADQYPMAEVVGTDLSPIQPKWVPSNCRFEVDDAEKDWTFKDDSFDYIHARNLVQSISDWDWVLSEIFRCTKPGGWAELAELSTVVRCDDGTMADDNAFKIMGDKTTEAFEKMGRPAATEELLRKRLEEAGFVDVQAFNPKQPFGPWPKNKHLKQVGSMVLLVSATSTEAYGMAALTRILGMDPVKAKKLCDDAFKAIKNKNHHMWLYFHNVWGRKPGNEE